MDNKDPKLQSLVYDILPLEEGAGKRWSECAKTLAFDTHNYSTSSFFFWNSGHLITITNPRNRCFLSCQALQWNMYVLVGSVCPRFLSILSRHWPFIHTLPYLSTHTVYQYKILFFSLIILGRYGHIGKWIQEIIIFMRFCCCFKLSKKTEKLSNKQPRYAIAKCTLIGLVQ